MLNLRFTVLALAILPALGWASPAFELAGLHIGLLFDQAVKQAEQLGGECAPVSVSGYEGVVVHCDYTRCDGKRCEYRGAGKVQFDIGATVLRVGLEARDRTSRMSRISIVYSGDSDDVEARLIEQFGKPYNDTSEYKEQSWSHARRVSWRAAGGSLGLMKTSKVITLTGPPGPGT